MSATNDEKLKKIEEKEKALEEKKKALQEEQKKIKEQKQKILNQEKEKERKADARNKIILGGLVIKYLGIKNPSDLELFLVGILNDIEKKKAEQQKKDI